MELVNLENSKELFRIFGLIKSDYVWTEAKNETHPSNNRPPTILRASDSYNFKFGIDKWPALSLDELFTTLKWSKVFYSYYPNHEILNALFPLDNSSPVQNTAELIIKMVKG